MFTFDNIWIDYLVRLSASFLCGFFLGLERKIRQHTVGMRTLILISISSCMLSILSVYMAAFGKIPGDSTRIAAGVITGIGFLGAGAIINQGLNIRGLTSAAVIFTASALGITCGSGLYFPALIVLLFSFIALCIIGKIEYLLFPAEKRKTIIFEYSTNNIEVESLKAILKKYGIIVFNIDIDFSAETEKTTLLFSVKSPVKMDSISLCKEISQEENLINFSISDNY